jgi:GT2 family glycosyltransferase
VVVCSRNGARTIRDCLEGLARLDYPDYEVVVVNDGSRDTTEEIAREYDVRLISTKGVGLSAARNLGMEAARGEIVAYIDDDAYPDPHWLTYLAAAFQRTAHAAIGGPNIAPPGDGFIAEAVARAPGGPIHVLLSDTVAEHIPGCNMAFRRSCLQAVGGFDPQFRVAGDDVDVCWRLQQQGWTLGYNPAAMVWHHRRNSLRAFWRQQKGYGKAEALLERKWPEKYNSAGHHTWSGRVYGDAFLPPLGKSGRIYHGIFGQAPFQSLYQPAPGLLSSLPMMPEWVLVVAVLGALSALGLVWHPLLATLPLFLLASAAPLAQSWRCAVRMAIDPGAYRAPQRLALRLLTAALHLVQPQARLHGRLVNGLSPLAADRPLWGIVALAAEIRRLDRTLAGPRSTDPGRREFAAG